MGITISCLILDSWIYPHNLTYGAMALGRTNKTLLCATAAGRSARFPDSRRTGYPHGAIVEKYVTIYIYI